MGTLANVFALLADHESENVSSIAGLDTDVKLNNSKNDNKMNNSAGRGKECHHGHGQRSFVGNVVDQSYNGHQHNGRWNGYVNGSGNHYGRADGPLYVNGGGNPGDGPVYKRSWHVKGIAGDGQSNVSVLHKGPTDGFLKDRVHMTSCHQDNYRPRNRRAKVTEIGPDQEFEDNEVIGSSGGNQKQEADNSPVTEEVKDSHGDNQEQKAVDDHGNENQGKVSSGTEVLSKEELRERTRRAKEEAEEKVLAKLEERKRQMAMKTLKEYEQQKAEKATLNVPETRVRGVTLDKDLESMLVLSNEKKDDIYTKQKSKNETIKKNRNSGKDVKVHKLTMSIEEFMKLPTGNEGQGGTGSSYRSEDSMKNTNGGERGRGRGRGGVSRNNENSNHGATRRGRSNSRDSRNNEKDNHGDNGRGRSGYSYSRNRSPDLSESSSFPVAAPDLSESSSFPVLGEATKPRKDL